MSEECLTKPDNNKPGSPIPGKIQEVLQQFQERLTEKDVQITELQKKIETLEIGGSKVLKTLSFRTTKNPRETSTRPPTGKQQNTPNGTKNGKHVRSNTNNSDKNISTTTVTSKSVPTSPSKKPNIPPKPTLTRRPTSRQTGPAPETSNGASTRPSRGTVTRTASVDRGKINSKIQEKIPPKKMKNDTNGTNKLPKQMNPKLNFSNASGDKMLNFKLKCQSNKFGTSADSLSTHSAESQTSSLADFVSVSSGASPSPTQSVECNLLSADDATISYTDLALRLKRLTEEHDKLQAEHARLRLQLGSSQECSDGESRMISSSGLWSSKGASEVESDNSLMDGVENQTENAREFCKEEVLRLRDELLNLQKSNNEMNKRLEERFARIQDLLDEREKLNKLLTVKGLEIDQINEKFDNLKQDNELKTTKLTKIEDEFQRLKNRFEVVDAKNKELRIELDEKTQSLKELEKEAFEMKDFMQAERSTLSEALSDSENQLENASSRVAHLQSQLEVKTQSLQAFQTNIETQKLQLSEYQTEIDTLKTASRDLLLKQGAELSCSSVALSQIVQNLESIVLKLTSQTDGKERSYRGVSSAVLPECDQQVSPNGTNGEEKKESIVAAVLEAVDHEISNKENIIDDKRPDVDVSNDFGIGVGMKRDDSAVSINSILSEGGDCPLLVGDLSQVIAPGKVGCLLDQVKDVEGLLLQLGKLINVTCSNYQIEVKKLRDKSVDMKSELEQKLAKAESRVSELELKDEKVKKELEAMQNQLNSSQKQTKQLITDNENEIKDLKQQIKELSSAQKLMEIEKKESIEQIAEYSKRIDDLACRNNGVSESIADLVNEKYNLKKELHKLKVHLNEKEEEINNMRMRYTKHTGILQSNCKYADNELKQLEELLDSVVKTLQSIPEVVNNCDSLKSLLNRLIPDITT